MNRLWILGAVLMIGVVVVRGWMLGVSPKLGEVRAAKADQASVESQNAAFETQLATLKDQFDSIGELRTELSALREAVPAGADMPAFIGQLDEIAKAHNVTLTAITVSDAQAYLPVVAAPLAEAAPGESAAPGEGAAPGAAVGDSAAAAPAAPAPAPAAPAPTVNALVTAANFVAIPITLSVDGSYDGVLDFVEGLQLGERLVMVTTFTTSVTADSGNVTGAITGFVYVLLEPGAAAAATVATEAG